ncbi:MAG: ATP-binding protein [Myxococcota bacterium]
MIPRHAAPTVLELARGFPAVVVTGPRQSGKTTLVRACFPDRPYVSLEAPDEHEAATEDPRGFLARFPDGAVLDEVQRCPELLSYLQGILDSDGRMGLFVLTGSQQLGLLSQVSQSLAGRVGLVDLLPFTLGELQAAERAPETLEALLWRGLYPPIYDRAVDPGRWYASYVRTYVERDVRQMVNVRDLATFQRFLRMCAARTGQLVNLSGLASDCGVTHNTARSWLSVLEAGFVVHRLQPHHRNFSKRLVKTPKLYFWDAGLAAWLLGVRRAEELATHAMRGPLFETWAVAEIAKAFANRGEPPPLAFWRDRAGHEIDVLVERAGTAIPVEVKSGLTVTRDQLKGLRWFSNLAGDAVTAPTLIYGGDRVHSRGEVRVVGWPHVPGWVESEVAPD